MATKNYLPIGSVILAKDCKKRFMIYGIKQISKIDNKEYDYVGCLYPEGFLNPEQIFLFNHDDIEMIFFIGFQDVEQFQFRSTLKKALSEKEGDL